MFFFINFFYNTLFLNTFFCDINFESKTFSAHRKRYSLLFLKIITKLVLCLVQYLKQTIY